MKKYWLLALMALSMSAYGQSGPGGSSLPKLSQYEEGIVVGSAYMTYGLALLTIKQGDGTTTTGLDPYVCWPFPVEWEVFLNKIRYETQIEVKQMSGSYRKSLGENFKYVVWEAITNEYGCWE